MFDRLGRDAMLPIVELQLDDLEERLKSERSIELDVTPEAKEWLAAAGYDPQYGARPLRRAIQQNVYSPMATSLLSGAIRDNEVVHVEVDSDGHGVHVVKNHEDEL